MNQPSMTGQQYASWTVEFRKRFLGPGENYGFLDTWEGEIRCFCLDDALLGLRDLGKDERVRATHPRFFLPLLLEYIRAHHERRRDQADAERRRRNEAERQGRMDELPTSTFAELVTKRKGRTT